MPSMMTGFLRGYSAKCPWVRAPQTTKNVQRPLVGRVVARWANDADGASSGIMHLDLHCYLFISNDGRPIDANPSISAPARQPAVFAVVVAPAVRLGIKLQISSRGTVVSGVRTSSVLAGSVRLGDRIVKVDGEDVSRMNATEVLAILKRKADSTRVLSFLRPKDVKGSLITGPSTQQHTNGFGAMEGQPMSTSEPPPSAPSKTRMRSSRQRQLQDTAESKATPSTKKKSTGSAPKKEKKSKKKRDLTKPPSPYNLFVREHKDEFIEANPKPEGADRATWWNDHIHPKICNKWKSLSDIERKPYEDKAATLGHEFYREQAQRLSQARGTSASKTTAATSSTSSGQPSAAINGAAHTVNASAGTPGSSRSGPPARPVTDQKSKADGHECGGSDQNVSMDDQRHSAVADGDQSKVSPSPSHGRKAKPTDNPNAETFPDHSKKRKQTSPELTSCSQSKRRKQSSGNGNGGEDGGAVTKSSKRNRREEMNNEDELRSPPASGKSQLSVEDSTSAGQPKSGQNGNGATDASTQSGYASVDSDSVSSLHSVLVGEASVRDKLDFCQMSLHPSYKKSILTKSAELSNLTQNEDHIMEFMLSSKRTGTSGNKAQSPGFLYVCGGPGTGKVRSVRQPNPLSFAPA